MVNLLATAYPDWSRERAETLAASFQLPSLPERPVAFTDTLPAAWDQENAPDLAAATVGAERNCRYLQWRYADHPTFAYRFLAVPEGRRTGLAVWRLETIRAATPAGREDLDRIARLVEFLPSSADNARQLAHGFLQQAAAAGAFAADSYCYHGQTRTWLEQAGFAAVGEHGDQRAVPSRFQPLDGKGGAILSAIFVPDGTPAVTAAPDCPWYWTRSDSDQDRPN